MRGNGVFAALAGLVWGAAQAGAAIGVSNCSFQPVSNHVFVLFGSLARDCPGLGGRLPINVGAIITNRGVVLVDPGPSPAVTARVLDRLRTVTPAPVIAVIDSHVHGPYWLGNGAVRAGFPDAPILAHPRMIERLQEGESDFWATTLDQPDPQQVVLPDTPVRDGDVLAIGDVILKLHHLGHAHTDHDLLVEVQPDAVLFLGGLVVEPEIPSQGVPQDADFRGQIAAVSAVAEWPIKLFVPGRGRADGRTLPDRAAAFLRALLDAVAHHYDEGLLDWQMVPLLRSDLAGYRQWYDFAALGRVVSEVYLQVEAESF